MPIRLPNFTAISTATAVALCSLLSGCQGGNAGNAADSVWMRMLRAQAKGRAADAAVVAASRNNGPAARAALRDLQAHGAAGAAALLAGNLQTSPAEALVVEASEFSVAAMSARGTTQIQLERQAADRYRQALELEPEFDSLDPNKLNSLAYFLADRGRSQADFQTGEKLARRAMELHDATLQGVPPDSQRGLNLRFIRANTRDTLAWALYRQGKFAEAFEEQKAAVREAEAVVAASKAIPGLGGVTVPEELHEHLEAIRQGLGNPQR